jgi:ribulose-phosphate 3-epimerase
VMTVEPGFGGQAFMADMMPKVREISDYIRKNKLDCKIEVDGGIDPATAQQAIQAGADVLVAGNAIFGAANPVDAVKKLKSVSSTLQSPR